MALIFKSTIHLIIIQDLNFITNYQVIMEFRLPRVLIKPMESIKLIIIIITILIIID
jgi:hypothetical protein